MPFDPCQMRNELLVSPAEKMNSSGLSQRFDVICERLLVGGRTQRDGFAVHVERQAFGFFDPKTVHVVNLGRG